MKVLFDHNVPHKLRTNLVSLSKHEIITASYLGWGELTNGELVQRAEKEGFEVFVTGDQRLVYKQDLSRRKLAVVALSTNNWPIIKNYLAAILASIDGAAPGSIQTVECGTFIRNKPPSQ